MDIRAGVLCALGVAAALVCRGASALWSTSACLLVVSASTGDFPTIDEFLAREEGHDLSIVVLDGEGRPVEGAEVFVYYTSLMEGVRDRMLFTPVTDARGEVIIKGELRWEPQPVTPPGASPLPPISVGNHYLFFLARHAEHGMGAMLISSDGTLKACIELEPTIAHEVVAVDQHGAPVAGARVYLRWLGVGEEHHVTFEADYGFCSAETDEDGRAELWAPSSAGFCVEKPGYVRAFTTGEAVLQQSVKLTGRVTFEDGTPASHAGVWLEFEQDRVARWRRGAETDAEGRYAFPDAPSATYRGQVFPDGTRRKGKLLLCARDLRVGSPYQTGVQELVLDEGDSREVDLVLKRPYRISGRMVDIDSGEGVEGIPLQFALRLADRSAGHIEVVSGEDGAFEVYVPPDAGVSAIIRRQGGGEQLVDEAWRLQNIPLFSTWRIDRDLVDLRWSVKTLQTHRVRGRLRDTAGRPVGWARIYGPAGALSSTDSEGRFDFEEGLKDRDWELFAVGSGPWEREACYARVDKGEHRLELTMQPLRAQRVRVEDTNGAPATALELEIAPYINGAPIRQLAARATVDGEGYFTIEEACPGARYSVSTRNHEDLACALEHWIYVVPATPEADVAPLTIARYDHTIRGRVLDEDGAPLPGAGVAVQTWRAHESGRATGKVSVDEDGSFAIPGIRRGEVTLVISGPGHHDYRYTTAAREEPFTFRLRRSENPAIAILTVVDELDQPMGDVPVDLFGTPDMSNVLKYPGAANGEGRFSVPWSGFKDNERHAVVACRVDGATFGFLALKPNEDVFGFIRVRRQGPRWRGRVVDARQRPVGDALLRVVSVTQNGHARCVTGLAPDRQYAYTTDSGGRFELADFSRYDTVHVEVVEKGNVSGTAFLVAEDRPNVYSQPIGDQLHVVVNRLNEDPAGEALIALPEGVRLTGRVILHETGKPLEGVPLYLKRSLQDDLWTRTDARGRFKFVGLRLGRCMLSIPGRDPEGNAIPYILKDPMPIHVVDQRDIEVEAEAHRVIVVSGKVVDAETGGPPPHRVVVVLDTGADLPYGIETEEDGSWRMYAYAGVFDIAIRSLSEDREFARFKEVAFPSSAEELTFKVAFPER